MHWLVAAWLLPGIAGGFLPSIGGDPLAKAYPLEGQGDIHFEADAARFLEADRPVVDLMLLIPRHALGVLADSAHIDLTVEMLNRKGKGIGAFQREMSLVVGPDSGSAAAPSAPGVWVRLTAPLLSGSAGVRVRLEDENRQKGGLLDRARGKNRSGQTAGKIGGKGEATPPLPPIWMSDLLFVRGEPLAPAATGTGPGLRAARTRLEPNPYRYYGLREPTLSVYWERYPPPVDAGLAAGAPLIVRYRIRRLADSTVVQEAAESLSVSADPEYSLRRFDVSELKGGSYRCEVALTNPRSPGAAPLASSQGDFQVVWERSSWDFDESQILDFARVLLLANEFEQFERLDRGGKEVYLRKIWNRAAPGSPPGANPVEKEFFRRVEYAEQNYHGMRAGYLGDRGRTYIRYGPPDKVTTQLNPQDMQLLWIALPDQIQQDGVDSRAMAERMSRPRTPEDNSAYEIWEYMLHGAPLLSEYTPTGQKAGLKFIFVDESGTGDYQLVYSNDPNALN